MCTLVVSITCKYDAYLHGEGLPRGGLAVGEYRAVHAAGHRVDDLLGGAVVNGLRRAVLVEDAVVGEERSFPVRKRVSIG